MTANILFRNFISCNVAILCFIVTAPAQNNTRLKEKLQKLRDADAGFVFSYAPNMRLALFHTTYVETTPEYLFWVDQSGCYVQKFAQCYDSLVHDTYDSAFSIVKLNDCEPASYLFKNLDSIRHEKLLPGFLKYNVNGRDSVYAISGSHVEPNIIKVYKGQVVFEKTVRWTELEDGSIHNDDGSIRMKEESLNYEKNVSTHLYKLYKLIEDLLNLLDDKQSFYLIPSVHKKFN